MICKLNEIHSPRVEIHTGHTNINNVSRDTYAAPGNGELAAAPRGRETFFAAIYPIKLTS